MPRRTTAALVVLVVMLALAGCGRPPATVELLPPPTGPAARTAYPPIEFPRDEAPHNVLTEWWYYTGHLWAADGRRYGFEYVIFQTVRGDYPVLYLGQFAITDRSRESFQHSSRLAQGSQIGRQDGLDLTVQEWRMQARLGQDQVRASMENYAIDLQLQSQKPPALHDYDGLVSFGPAGDSYYYSHTRMAVAGTLIDHGEPIRVEGQAWFDHQWGDFLVMGGGWDWFSMQLDDGNELMLNYLRDRQDRVVGVWGSLVDGAGVTLPLSQQDFQIEPTAWWVSPASGGRYPMGWQVSLKQLGYELQVRPVLADQELVSTGAGPTYWEGAAEIEGTRNGAAVRGLGYVELTGYAVR
jgi:predicted secreted hydrolase